VGTVPGQETTSSTRDGDKKPQPHLEQLRRAVPGERSRSLLSLGDGEDVVSCPGTVLTLSGAQQRSRRVVAAN
ncbi:MAG: hypothetical protein ACJA0V_001399, partial [Planctomycetota bacterium]